MKLNLCDFKGVKKYEADKDYVKVFTSQPNGCGYVIRDGGRDKSILVGILTFKDGRYLSQRTERISIDYWNSLNHLECCNRQGELINNAGIPCEFED